MRHVTVKSVFRNADEVRLKQSSAATLEIAAHSVDRLFSLYFDCLYEMITFIRLSVNSIRQNSVPLEMARRNTVKVDTKIARNSVADKTFSLREIFYA